MREGNRRRPIRRRKLALVGLLGALSLVAATPAAAAAAPVNDNYLSSLRLNDPGTRLDRTDTLRDVRDTTGATVQTDVFNPPMMGAPAEPTTCQGVNYGATVWYDFHPDVNGAVRLRTSGFDNVISLVPFDEKTAQPDFANRRCVTNLATMTQELDAPVAAGKAYTVQIGGVNNAQGMLEFLFDFIPDITRITADATLIAQALPTGILVRSLNVTAPKGTHVSVRCSAGCRPQAKTATTVRFPRLGGTRLKSGARLQIFVTAANSIGVYVEYKIRRGNFSKLVRCLEPGSLKPKQTC
jgi:hypothetical protein